MEGTAVDNEVLTLFPMDETLRPQLIPMELNLEGWPLFTRQKASTEGVIEIRHSISTEDGRRLNQVWRVAASADNTLPGPFDEDVFVGVMALVRQRGGMPPDGRIRFSIYELSKVMGKGKRGGWTKKIRASLDRIGSTTYYMENCFYVVETESLESYRFPLWTVHFSGAKSGHGRAAEHHTLKFDDTIIRSYNAGYLKLLDTDLYFRLSRTRSPLAKALYRLVDQRRRDASSWSVDVFDLRNLLAMSQSYKAASRIWEVLQPAIRVLKQEKFLESAVLDGDTARLKVHPGFACDWFPSKDAPPDLAPATLRDQAIAALVEKDVTPDRAVELVDRFGPEKAFHVLDVLSVRGDLETKANPGGYVYTVMKNGDPAELAEAARFARDKLERAVENGTGASEAPDGMHYDPQPERGVHDDAAGGGRPDAPAVEADLETCAAATELWGSILSELEDEIDPTSLRVWFAGISPLSLRDGLLVLAVPNIFAKEYIESRFRHKLRALVEARSCRLGILVGTPVP